MLCADCGQPTGRRYARYCDAHRWRHRIKPAAYPLTPERRAYMLAHYQPSARGISHHCAAVLGVPKWRVCRWAAELGLTNGSYRNGSRDWTPAEDALLEAHIGSRHLNWIAKRLGRSVTAVQVHAKRLSISRRDAREWFTAHQLAMGFGVDPSTPVRWIERGWLQAKHEGRDCATGRAAAWRIEVRDVRRFVQEHPAAFSLAKVDQVWFLNLVFNGNIGQVKAA